jgi:tetratricopeptide (TPR) repeat protein
MNQNGLSLFLSTACLFLVLFAVPPFSSADPQEQSAENLFQQGNNLYDQGKYKEALQIYNRIMTENGVSAPLLYNIGNCHAQSGSIGLAILNYERALRLTPGDSDIRGNLDLLRKKQGLFQEKIPPTERLGLLLRLDQWTMAASTAYLLFTLINLAGLRFFNNRKALRWANGICLLLLIIALTGILAQYRQRDEAVVVGSDTRLFLSPFSSAAPLGTIQEGRVVRQSTKHGDYVLVADDTGRSGWIESQVIEPILDH